MQEDATEDWRALLALSEDDNTLLVGARSLGADERERHDFEREDVLRDAMQAWRDNPLARRIIELTSEYVIGGGIQVSCEHEATHAFIQAFWNHPLNQLPARMVEWCDELGRSGELFLLVTTGADGMSYVRAIPAIHIVQVLTAKNDLQQESGYVETLADALEPRTWPSYTQVREAGKLDGFVLHYAVNRLAGTVRGESDLAPVLRWIRRYSGWLEDRARLNRYRNTFLFVVRAKFASESERQARQVALSAAPPSPGSILVVDESETWEVLNPQLESRDANEDGLALKKMIASGAGLPLHFLAEPEGSTRTTAESAGGPTYRRFEQRQEYFVWLLQDLLRVVLERRALVDHRVRAGAKLRVTGADLSARDNASQALAASTVIAAFRELRERGLIDDAELLRMAYKFAGESVDVEEVLRAGKQAGQVRDLSPDPPGEDRRTISKPAGIKIDADGEPGGSAAIA
jgi:hypothetical protein